MVTWHVVGIVGHHGRISFCRRKRDAGRNGSQGHDHGQKAERDEAAME
jgi:hypothetical protein